MTPRQQSALAVFGVVLAALLTSVRESTKVSLPAFVVLSMAILFSLAFLLWSFDKLPLRTVGIFVVAIAAGVGVVVAYRIYQENVIPSDVRRSREDVRGIQLAIARGDACMLEVSLSDPSDSVTAHRLWMRYGSTMREALSEEIVEGSKLFRWFLKAGKVIALEEPAEGGRFRMQYIRDGCLIAIDYLDQSRMPLELEYFGDCGMSARRLGPSSIWFWPKHDEAFKEPTVTNACTVLFRRDSSETPNRQPPPVPTPGLGYR